MEVVLRDDTRRFCGGPLGTERERRKSGEVGRCDALPDDLKEPWRSSSEKYNNKERPEAASEQMQFATCSKHGQANWSPHDFANHVSISCHGNIDLPPGRVVKVSLMAVLSAPLSTANTCSVYCTSGVRPDLVLRVALSVVSSVG